MQGKNIIRIILHSWGHCYGVHVTFLVVNETTLA